MDEGKEEKSGNDNIKGNKTKHIKKGKANNYVRLDLNRKYREGVVGSINAFQTRYNRNGRLKEKYRSP